jgi:large subunit ribosomal protein L23
MGHLPLELNQLLRLIKYPLLTEKSIKLQGINQYTFIVDRTLTKTQLKYVFESIFRLNRIQINTCHLPIKKKRVGRFVGKKTAYKKVYISVQKGESIPELH